MENFNFNAFFPTGIVEDGLEMKFCDCEHFILNPKMGIGFCQKLGVALGNGQAMKYHSEHCGEKTVSLDVGCGDRPRGDVNCDLFVGESAHLGKGRGWIMPKKIPNFVKCDANYLPFKKGVFDVVFCSHVLEHKGVNAVETSKELVRVAKRKIVIVVPSLFRRVRKGTMHDKTLTLGAFKLLFRQFKRKVRFQTFNWEMKNLDCYFPICYLYSLMVNPIISRFGKMPFGIVPSEIKCEVWKNEED